MPTSTERGTAAAFATLAATASRSACAANTWLAGIGFKLDASFSALEDACQQQSAAISCGSSWRSCSASIAWVSAAAVLTTRPASAESINCIGASVTTSARRTGWTGSATTSVLPNQTNGKVAIE